MITSFSSFDVKFNFQADIVQNGTAAKYIHLLIVYIRSFS
jgi:hypothetical protein